MRIPKVNPESNNKFAFSINLPLSGIDEVNVKLDSVKKQSKHEAIDPVTLEEFKTFFKYLAFVACAARAPVRGKMLDKTIEIIKKGGTPENIERWCWWTPDQLSLLEQAENLPRVLLIGKKLELYVHKDWVNKIHNKTERGVQSYTAWNIYSYRFS